MVTWEEIIKESEEMKKELGPEFFKELGQAIHQGELELAAERRRRKMALQKAYIRNSHLLIGGRTR